MPLNNPRLALAICCFLMLVVAVPLASQTFVVGDLVVAGSGLGPNPPTFNNWKILWLDANGNLKGVLYDQPQTGASHSMAAFGPGGVLYAIADGQLLRILANGSASPIASPSIIPSYFTVAANGDLYVSQIGGSTILRINASGQLIQTYNVGASISTLDLASDQCTLYYATSPQQIRRFDVCASAHLTPFTAVDAGMTFGYLRILPTSLLHSRVGTGGVARRDNAGQIVQSYAGWGFALALDSDRASFWTLSATAPAPELFKVDITTGGVLRGPISLAPHLRSLFSIAVVGEPRAAIAAANTADVPVASRWMLAMLCVIVVAIAVRTIH